MREIEGMDRTQSKLLIVAGPIVEGGDGEVVEH